MTHKEFDIEVLAYYPEQNLKNKGGFKGRFDVHIKELGILYSNVMLFGDGLILLGGNKYKNKAGKEIIGQFLRLKDLAATKSLQSSIKKACREWMDQQSKE